MTRYPKNCKDVEYYVPNRKRRVAGSTKATGDFLALIHKENPTATVAELHSILTDESKWLLEPEAVEVLNAHIRAGYGSFIPDWD